MFTLTINPSGTGEWYNGVATASKAEFRNSGEAGDDARRASTGSTARKKMAATMTGTKVAGSQQK